MKTYVYCLRFKGPVHFGTTGIGLEDTLERLSSDSLTSALINAFSIMGGADEAISALTAKSPAFLLSSLFPYGKSENDSGTVYALPRPLSKPPLASHEIARDFGKDLKKVRYLDASDFAAWIGGRSLSREQVGEVLTRSEHLGKHWDKDSGAGWFALELRPRVALDRVSQNSNVWHCGVLHFQKDAGLFGLVTINDDSWENDLSSAFSLLGDLGIGGERTYGMGTFDFGGFEPLDKAWTLVSEMQGEQYVLLSSYFPADDERDMLMDSLIACDFRETRGYVVSGRMPTTFKRKRVRMIAEGSVLRAPLQGKMVVVSPDSSEALGLNHPIYRSGLAFILPQGGAR